MPQGLQTLDALLILLPGFVSARIARPLSTQGQQSELERVIEALIFSFFNYLVYVALFGTSLPIEGLPTFQVHRWRVVFLALMACGMGLLWGIARSKDLILRPLRAWRLTERTSRQSVWNDAFVSLQSTAQVGLKDGRSVIGYVRRYSDTDGERSVFLESSSWIAEDGSLVEIIGKGILLTEKADIEYVMFLNDATPEAKEREA